MEELAPGVWHLEGRPRWLFNVYLIGDVVIDAAIRASRRRILRELEGHAVAAHALTHAHPDHNGASKAICETFERALLGGGGRRRRRRGPAS